jgi:lipopolysaccharide/colanic/teichoic acid biosynthesis glycosyltransferase
LYVTLFKRVADVFGAAVLLVALAPVMIVVAVVVWLIHGRPILFRDERAGLDGEPIRVTKFRSMRAPGDSPAGSHSDEERLTPLGRFLRRTSLDELPQLFSVLRGDMSLVGPRPLPMRYVSRYTPRQATRLRVRPGLTGWAQIHGRNALAWPDRLEYDAEYVDMAGRWWAPFLDVWIILATVVQVVWQALTGKGVSAPGYATMQEFSP